ncbi:hypothetical protein AYO21_06731 [Fonsecaea monophora]|uniref:Uncharacterized protein n=1 Tax=Fonsecaea monophora TaxID=254056 RepID=A0A177F5R1_9EURO|nr:hypothetical protein AYO21_06731 [Fonsecaea monophora]KAH0829787.1 hypothetical protein FOPE_10657 [Fonsecaea pedrosoi]OAG39011.1 hypothetical protein AYO21_06731 [Fonsecaea monophora]
MAPHRPRRVNADAPIESLHGSSGLTQPHHHHLHLNNTEGSPCSCCSGGGHHGCGCGCAGCWCRLGHHFKDDSNRETYGGQGGGHGGAGGMPSPAVGRPRHVSRFDESASSFQSSGPSLSTGGFSFDNSFEVPAPLTLGRGQAIAANTAALNINARANGHHHASEDLMDDDGPHPWSLFTESPNSLDHMFFGDDSSGMVIPGLNDDLAPLARGPGSSVADRTTLSSQYESSFSPQPSVSASASASQIVAHVGAAFEDLSPAAAATAAPSRFLRLTPECSHNLHHSI